MKRTSITSLSLAAIASVIATGAIAQTPPAAAPAAPAAPPLYAVTKVDGTDNVYVFRYQNHQAMFIVTPEGVIATDPISYGRPQAAQAYLDEIRKITKAPIKYLIYSHHHYDHIAGGEVFKKAGAKVVAHRRATERLKALKGKDVVIPDELVGDKRTIKLGDHARSALYRPQSLRTVEENSGPELGPPNSRSPRSGRAARHQEGYGGSTRLHDRPERRGEESL